MLNRELLNGFTFSPVGTYLQCAELSEKALGVVLQPDSSATEFGLHRVLKRANPDDILGIDFNGFEFLRKITVPEFAECQSDIIQMFGDDPDNVYPFKELTSNEVTKFVNLFTPAFFPQKGLSALMQTTEQIIKINDGFGTSNTVEPMVGIDSIPDKYDAPSAFLPHDSMFDSCLDDLKIEDILTIFPETEAKLLALCIGRALVGADKTSTTIGGHDISHAFRTFCLVYGTPGTGKSTLFDFLFDAIESTGYRIAHFNEMDSHFGLGEIVNANIAYSDDLLTGTLKGLLAAPLFKQCITGNKIRAHIKFANDVEVRSIATFFACINNFDHSILNFCDAGTLNRLAILTTYSNREINLLKPTGLTANSPNLRTRENIEWLANDLGIDRKAVMLKFARLCADMFWNEIKNGTLEQTINALKRNLRTQLHEGLDSAIMQLMQFSYLIRNQVDFVPQINGFALRDTFESLNFVLNDDRANFIRNILKEDWIKHDRPASHMFTAVKLLDNLSVSNIATTDLNDLILRDPVKSIKAYWADLRLTSGFNVASNVGGIRMQWSLARSATVQDCMDIIELCKSDQNYEIVIDKSQAAQTDYLRSASYDREAHIESLNA